MVVRNYPGADGGGHASIPKTTASVSALTMDDYDEVVALWRACDGVGLNESDERAPLAAFLARNPGLSLVLRAAVSGNGDRKNGVRDRFVSETVPDTVLPDTVARVIGAVLCGHDGRRGYLHHLAVAPEQRGQGLGRLLVERCLASLAELGIAKCNVFLFADNDEGARFWQAVGFGRRTDLLVLQSSTQPGRGSLSP
ncbi:MAG: GNAT family N-acetyltransferase [Armatimonadetes bacterium]|nr:GNAT family N-acetyltransferase [Armatimonadota bacterium]